MSWLARLRNVFRPDEVSDEIDREMAFHLAERTDELVAAGASPEEARREAQRRFGRYLLQKEDTRERDVLMWLETLLTDFRYGLRGLRRSPVFCLAAVLTLAIGIGANTAVFTLLHGLLLRSLPVPNPQELARIGLAGLGDSPPAFVIPYRMIQQLRQEQRSFVDLSAWTNQAVAVSDPDGTIHQYQAGLVSGNAFSLLGARPRLGRLIDTSDDVRGGPAQGWSVVVSDGLWRDRFAADPRVVGSSLKVSGTFVTIVGVTPPSFHGVWPGVEAKLYLPMQFFTVLQGGRDDLNSPTTTSAIWCAAIGRLRPGVSHADANVESGVYQQRLLREFTPPDFLRNPRFANVRLTVDSARTGLPTFFSRTYSAPLYLMQGLVGIVLLLCCVNVSGLMMSKLHERQHEFAVRTALGAGRLRLVRQYLAESFVIALAGAALGAAIAWYGTGLLLPFFRHPNMGTGLSVQPDHTVFVVTAALAVLTTLSFGMWPAWRAGASNPGTLLKSRTAAATDGRPGLRRHPGGALPGAGRLGHAALAEPDPPSRGADGIRPGSRHDPDTALPSPAPERGGQAEPVSADGRPHRTGGGGAVGGRHLVHAHDRFPGHGDVSGPGGRNHVSGGGNPRLQRGRSGIFPDDGNGHRRGPRVRAARALARRLRAEPGRGRLPVPPPGGRRPLRADVDERGYEP